jgi:tetratricopeptide (TPR) repeat protein
MGHLVTRLDTALMTAVLCCFLAFSSGSAQEHEHSDRMPADARLGAVSFEISCKAELQPDFNRAVALLHSFWHSEAQRVFERVAAADPNCAMAYWGVAMSNFHLGLSWPAAADVALGREALTQAEAAAEKDAREVAYIAALRELYTDFKIEDSWKYYKTYANQLSKIAAMYPKDLEAKVFEGLALILAQQPGEMNLTELKQAVNLLQPLLQQYPDHPGIAHYLIHACDTPGLAQEGLEAARRYAKIAPAAPHALHMPSHIFTRLGLWQEDIDSNLASKAAAESAHAGAENTLHALEFIEYAYLQMGHDDEARAIIAEAKTIPPSEVDPRYGNYYATVQARFPTMFEIETHDWLSAAHAQPIVGDDGWGRGLTLLAHAVAAGHLRDRALAKATLQATEVFMKQQMKGRPLPRSGTAEAVFLDEIHAWTDFADRDLTGAIRLLRPIADRQDKVGKGELDLPVREMLAEMLLIDGKAKEALKEYQASLASDPNRFNGLLGAGRAAESLGDRDVAAGYYRKLLANCTGATGSALTALRHPRAVVDEMAIGRTTITRKQFLISGMAGSPQDVHEYMP